MTLWTNDYVYDEKKGAEKKVHNFGQTFLLYNDNVWMRDDI